MNKKLLFLSLMPSVALATHGTIFDNNAWYRDNNTLNVSIHDPFPYNGRVYDHSISYISPSGGRGNSDMCLVASPTMLSCYSGDYVNYDAALHAANAHLQYDGNYTYYEKGYQPPASAVTGNWHREQSNMVHCHTPDLVSLAIPYNEKNVTTLKYIYESFTDGFSMNNILYLVKDKFSGRLALSPDKNDTDYFSYYLYDANNNPIYDMSQLDRLSKLNDGDNASPDCNLTKTS